MLSKCLFQHQVITSTLTRSLYILLVEDNELVASLHQNFLSKFGYEADIAINGREALKMAKSKPYYDLILLDVGLPDMSGIEIARSLHHHLRAQCPIMIAITALSSDEIIKNCLEVGIKRVFVKPVDLATFKQILSHNVLLE